MSDVAGESEANACEALLQLADGGKTGSSNETTRFVTYQKKI